YRLTRCPRKANVRLLKYNRLFLYIFRTYVPASFQYLHLFNVFLYGNCLVMHLIFGTVEQCYVVTVTFRFYLPEQVFMLIELLEIFLPEFVPSVGVMIEPFAQVR